LLAGCVRFESQPLAPAETAARWEARSLTNAALESFLEQNLHRELEPWPIPSWDFEPLTLVAFYYHPSLDVARADWRVAAAGAETAGARPNPTVSASGIYEPVPSINPWIPGLSFDLPIETAGKRRWRTEQARHLSEAARLNLAAAAWQVRSGLRAALLDLAAAQRRAALLQRQVTLREDLAARLGRQLQAGAISAVELNTARLALIRARADLAEAQGLLAEARPRLADALGLPAAALQAADFRLDLTSGIAEAEALTTGEARRMALLGRADILGALADYAASQSALQLEAARQYPDIHLSPGYSWNAGSAGENDWQLGATVELPLFHRHQGPIAEAAARREASAARFLALQARVIGDIDDAVASFRVSQTNAATLDAVAAAQEAQEQSLSAQLQAGAVDRLDLLAADLGVNAGELARLDVQVKLQHAVGALENAIQRPLSLPKSILQSQPPDAR
jgi:outer membrane protein TolC